MGVYWVYGILTVLYYAFYPIYWLAVWLLYILYCIASPFIYIAYLIKEATLLPFRFLAQFEVRGHNPDPNIELTFQALWYFLGTAVLIGIVLALVCHFILRLFVVVFDLDRPTPPKPIPPTGHDVASYRAARNEKKQRELEKQRAEARKARLYAAHPVIKPPRPASADSPVSPGLRRHALSRETILEHTDEEDDDSIF